MSKCLLCSKKIGINEQSYGTFGLSHNSSLCESCFKDVKLLYDQIGDDSFNAESEKFLEKYNNTPIANEFVKNFFASESTIKAQKEAKNNRQKCPDGSCISCESSNGLFSNPGKTLLTMGKTFFWICCILGLIVGIILGNTTNYFGYQEFNFGLFMIPLISGLIIGYFGGLCLAAFGDLLINVKAIREHLSST